MGLVVLGLTSARAQYIPIYVNPPLTSYAWNGTNGGNPGPYDYYTGNYNWQTGSEWLGGSVPIGGFDVLFLDSYTGAQPRQLIEAKGRNLRSLWFEAGIWYTIRGNELTLGHKSQFAKGQQTDPYLLVVNSQNLQNTSEHTLEFGQFTIADSSHWKGVGKIENYSEGGLGIGGGKLGTGEINLSNQHIQIGGMGATRFWGQLTGEGTIDVGLFGGLEDEQPQPQLILQANSKDWNGKLRVHARGFAIIKADQALGIWGPQAAGRKRVYNDGSLALRSHVGSPLTYKAPSDGIPFQVTGAGIIRREGTPRIGALYNDGGQNSFAMSVWFSGDTYFGARGDREGGLTLDGRVYNNGTGDFIKVGPGLITLNNTATGAGANSWTGDTVIREGVLRILATNAASTSVSSTSNIVLAGGILELAPNYPFLTNTYLHFTVGTGPGQIRWEGSGGFSAFGDDSTVTLNGLFFWGNPLLLSSRYATHNITLTNNFNLFSHAREIRVERGVGNAHAILSGAISSSPNGKLRKTGRGLLELTGSNTYTGATIIEGGALSGIVPAASIIQLAGGVLGIDQDFSRTVAVGPSPGEIRWTGSGGFAAYGGTHSVTLANPWPFIWGPITWGGFIRSDEELRFGHYTANGTVNFTNNMLLGDGSRTIRIERGYDLDRADVVLSGVLRTDGVSDDGTPYKYDVDLYFVGDGRIDLSADNTNTGEVSIYGAELRLNRQGRIAAVSKITLRHGGTLFLDNQGTHDSETGGSYQADRIGDTTAIDLSASTLIYRPSSSGGGEKVGQIFLGGQNSIQIPNQGFLFSVLRAISLGQPNLFTTSTLHFSEASSRLRLDYSAEGLGKNDAGGVKIIPWATFRRTGGWQGFALANSGGAFHYVHALEDYHEGAQNTWTDAGLNVRMTASQVLNANRSVNSLILGGGSLNLGGRNLTINSGGLIANSGGTRTITGSGQIRTGSGQIGPSSGQLYVHAFGNLSLSGGAQISNGNRDLIKSQAGTLTLGSNVTHALRNMYIHRGMLNLQAGGLSLVNNGALSPGGRVTVGDGGGNATLKLAPNRWDQITSSGIGGGLPDITLNGTPYDPRGPEYGGLQAVLQMGGNTKQHIGNLHIQNRGTIDWVGGEVGKANILWVENLTFSGLDAQLFMRNWYEYEDFLLVRKANFDPGYLSQILFDGYQNYETTYRQWDKDYWQITPFGDLAITPEPSTWGSLLGVLGLGLYLIRRRYRRRRKAATQSPPDGEVTPRRQIK